MVAHLQQHPFVAGAGLGLAIVDKTVQRMGGIFALSNTTSGGLAAHIKLQRPRMMPPVPGGGVIDTDRKLPAKEATA